MNRGSCRPGSGYRRPCGKRNSWLRHGTLDAASQAAWDRELCLASAEIDEYRRAYIKALKPVFEQTLSELLISRG